MIKKFEQFVNEMYSSHKEQNHATKDRELLSYLYSIGVDREATTQILKKSQEVDFYYTPEEAENIFERIPDCDNSYKKAYAVVNVFFTVDRDFDEYCKEHNIPIVRGVNGKLLTGKVWYCSELGEYFESDEEIEDLDVELIDLDKEFGWRE
jgi:hypothetical protein